MPAFKPFPITSGVEPIAGEPLRFHVQSASRPDIKHLVDLQECGFNSACGCEVFQMKHLPMLRYDRREKRPPLKRRCKHIKLALEYFAEVMVRATAERLAAPVKDRKPYGSKWH